MGSGSDDAAAQHVIRTLRVLELLAEGPVTQADVANRLGIHRRTARRLLARLVGEGYADLVRRRSQVVFAATPRLVVLGRDVADGLDVVAIGSRWLSAIAPGMDVGRFIAERDDLAVVLAHLETTSDSETRVGARAAGGPLYATAPGKVFLSADDALLGEVLNHELLPFTGNTVVTRADLLLQLAAVRSQGYAVEDEEYRAGVQAVSSGVVNHAGQTVAALGATPASGVSLTDLGLQVRDAARALSRHIGARVPPGPAVRD